MLEEADFFFQTLLDRYSSEDPVVSPNFWNAPALVTPFPQSPEPDPFQIAYEVDFS